MNNQISLAENTLPLPGNSLPVNTPAEVIAISPEALEVANAYLQSQDLTKVAEDLDMPLDVITTIMEKREVRSYIDHVFMNVGFNNRFQMRHLMDYIIKKKLQELDEADISTSKDIIEVMTLSHKMSMEHLDREIALKKLDVASAPKVQTNIQINENNQLGGTKYGSLISQLLQSSQGNIVDV